MQAEIAFRAPNESLGFGFTFGSAPRSQSSLVASMSPRMMAHRSGVIL